MKSRENAMTRTAFRLILTLLLACAFFFAIGRLDPGADAADAGTYTISSARMFNDYITAYNAGERNPRDTIQFSISSGSAITNASFTGLGTADKPFAGTLVVPTGGVDTFDLYDRPLFNYVTTDMTVSGAGVIKIKRVRDAEGPGGALFADHVVAGTGDADWTVIMTDQSTDTAFGGVFGDIAADCTVTVNFTDNANVPVSGSGNVGFICGTLNAGATLNVTTAGTGGALSVSSTGGHAGGLVGEAGNGATLRLASANNTRVNAVSTTGADKYAGGLIGYADRVNLAWSGDGVDYAVFGTVAGTAGAGGLFGYYKNAATPVVFTLQNTFALGSLTVSADGHAGGVFGKLENTGASFTFNGNGETITVTLSDGTARGGICGLYQTDALTRTLEITNVTTVVTASTVDIDNAAASAANNKAGPYAAGLIGMISSRAAYVSVHDLTCTSAGTNGYCPDAGLIGSAGSGGSFIDVFGTVTITGRFNAGLVCHLPQGVLRLAGVTDLSGYVQWSDTNNWTSATIVRDRGRALVYALGTGEDANWTLKRNTTATIDDVHAWGEVLRLDGADLKEEGAGDVGLFTVDTSAHTVTVKAAVTAMANVTHFVRTALNIQLGTAANGSGALRFASANQSATLLQSSLSLEADVDLTGTGILGFTRDDGVNAAFSGTLNGGGHTLTMATGEVYGKDSGGSVLADSTRLGFIRRHLYNGLFAKTDGATIRNLTLDGVFNIIQDVDLVNVGGIAAYATGSLTLTDVTMTDLTFNYWVGAAYTAYIGGAVGCAAGTSLNVTVNKDTGSTTFRPIFKDLTPAAVTRGAKTTFVGGVIGRVEAASGTQNVSMTNVTIGLDYTKTLNTKRESFFGSAIASIANAAYAKDARTVSLTNVTVDMTATGTAVENRFGSILGAEWYAVDATISGLDIANASLTATGTANFGGLIRSVTGRLDIRSIELGTVNFKVTATGSTFGFVANKTYNSDSGKANALYLDIDNTGDNYKIDSLTFTGSTGTFTVFDEIVADSRYNAGDIRGNGHSIISIATDGNTIADGNDTYRNKTAYGTANDSINPTARYYYNIKYARAHTAAANQNFLVFSVWQYAHTSLAAWFVPAGYTFSGDLDMTGLSYYPVDLTRNVTFTDATLTLDNITMEGRVHNTDDAATTRTTRAATNQHYLMHTAVFRNVTADITVTQGTSGLTMAGNVPDLGASFCGFLIAGTLGGTGNVTPTLFTAADLFFDGVRITTNTGADLTGADFYAPLLINKIGKNTNLTVAGAAQSTTAYTALVSAGKYAASSLIGDVGGTNGGVTATAITLTFTGLVFDGTVDTTVDLSGAYGTSRSIFRRATLLNSLIYTGQSRGSYNFAISEDWPTATATHRVTYGKEITASVENAGKQKKYHSSEDYYVNPNVYQCTTDAYDFSTNFLPYVYVACDLANYKHELSINISYSGSITGYGKYDKPYLITSGSQLEIIARIISGEDVGSEVSIPLPGDLTRIVSETVVCAFDYTTTGYTMATYHPKSTNANLFVVNDSDETGYSKDVVRCYLAGAYYVVGNAENDIELSKDFVPLGATDATHPEYAFRGVLIGTGTATVVNKSDKPLIWASNGCVVKDLTVKVAVDRSGSHVVTLTTPAANATYSYQEDAGIEAWGAVIGEIMGGDTFIDSVQVTFASTAAGDAFNVTFAWSSNNNNNRLNPVGGYVGVIVNGGLIFRNMTGTYPGLTAAQCDKVGNAGYLYVNPIIGRVLAGYAFNETADAYNVSSAKIVNGNKNYTVSDLSLALAADADTSLNVTNKSSVFTVKVPNGQALFVLGAIVNSGATAATYNASIEQDYYNTDMGLWQGYRPYTAARGGSYYATVGAASGGDYTAAALDAHSDALNKIPYVIRAYTNKVGNVYFARALATRSNNVLTLTGDIAVPASFRGIGSIYYDNNYVRLRVGAIDGGDHTVTLAMRYVDYTTDAYHAVSGANTLLGESNVKMYSNAGFGLFNRLFFTGNGSGSNVVKDLTLTGSIYYDVLNIANGNPQSYLWNNMSADYVLNVGGLAGVIYIADSAQRPLYATNVTSTGLTVEGPKFAGGIVGLLFDKQSSTRSHTFIGCDASGAVITAGQAAGCYCGYLSLPSSTSTSIDNIVIQGVDAEHPAVLTNAVVTVKGPTSDSSKERISHAAGSLIGCCDIGYPASARYGMIIQYVRVEGGTYSFTVSEANASAGGLIGKIRGLSMQVGDVEILHVSIGGANAAFAGGIVGHMVIPRAAIRFDISGVLIDGYIDAENNAGITASQYVGGAVGNIMSKNTTDIGFSDIKIRNYQLTSLGTNGAAGGFFGLLNTHDYDNNCKGRSIGFHDIEVDACTLAANYTGAGVNDVRGVGGFFGTVHGHETKAVDVYGYNIMINATLTGAGTTNFGTFVGNNVPNMTTALRFVGVSVNVAAEGKTLGATENNGGGYVVFANYAADKANQTFTDVGDGYTNVDEANPYATVGNTVTAGGVTLTGDGVAADVASLPIQSILADNGGKYIYSAADLAAFDPYRAQLALFGSEAAEWAGTDFPVLVLESTDPAVSHAMISSYLRLLTNTRYDFKAADNGIYEIVIYNVTSADNTTFTVYSSGASLKWDTTDGFYMLNTAYDSGRTQYSLIDLRFFDPSDSGNVVYHLYVPVFVKKVLSYQFDIAALNGTSYFAGSYTGIYGQQLIENAGTPVTIYFQYTYSRTPAEWTTAIRSGEKADGNYAKALLFIKSNESVDDFNDDTVLVLIDRQTNTPYYALFSEAVDPLTRMVDLSVFRAVMTKNGNALAFSGAAFEPVMLSRLMTFTVTADAGNFVRCEANDPNLIVSVPDGGDLRYYRLSTGTGADVSATKYQITVTAVAAESYYLSVFTQTSGAYDKFHYYLVTTPESFSDGAVPARIIDTEPHTVVHLIMGQIFAHDWSAGTSVVSRSGDGTEVMTDDNTTLTVEMSVDLALSDDLSEDLRAEMQLQISSAHVYQSFLLFLSRRENDAITKVIVGEPTCTTRTYTVRYTAAGSPRTDEKTYDNEDVDEGDWHISQNRGEFITADLSGYFAASDSFTIVSTVTLTYTAGAIPAQFPGRGTTGANRDNGVTVSAASNIAFSQSTVSYSKNTIEQTDTGGNSYHSKAQPEIATLDLNPLGDRLGDVTPLGINPLDTDGNPNAASFDLLAVLDVTPIATHVETYDSAVVTVTLAVKQSDGSYSADLANVNQYITGVSIAGQSAALVGADTPLDESDDDNTAYTVTVAKTAPGFIGGGAEITLPVITLTVKTGAALEAAGQTYGNYRVTVSVVLKNADTELAESRASNFVIYTNAKVLPMFVDTD